jgi:two-component system sensor histidine kinase TctE
LAVLGTYCDLARTFLQEQKEQEAVDTLSELDSGINRMSKMVNRLLALARSEPIQAGNRSTMLVDLNNSASSVSAAHVPEALRKRIDLEFLSASEPAFVNGDPSAIEELISNLIENSIVYTQPSGNITVKVAVRDGSSMLTVSDDGPGIPPEERGHVFERFYRMPGTEAPGTGLGLAIVSEIATAHDAHVSITTPLNNKGASVSVVFPPPKGPVHVAVQNGSATAKAKGALRLLK